MEDLHIARDPSATRVGVARAGRARSTNRAKRVRRVLPTPPLREWLHRVEELCACKPYPATTPSPSHNVKEALRGTTLMAVRTSALSRGAIASMYVFLSNRLTDMNERLQLAIMHGMVS